MQMLTQAAWTNMYTCTLVKRLVSYSKT